MIATAHKRGGQMKKEKKEMIDEAHGLYLKIDDKMRALINNIMDADAKRKFPVTVEVDGKVKHYTLNTFVKKLGFLK